MEEAEKYSRYRKELIGMLNSINLEIPLKEEHQVLIVWKLDTVEKIQSFFNWIVENMKNGKLNATEDEVVRAAVKSAIKKKPLKSLMQQMPQTQRPRRTLR